MAGKMSLMEELKLKQRQRASSNSSNNDVDAKNESEKTPIKSKPPVSNTHKLANPQTKELLSNFLANRKPNRKPSNYNKSSLPTITGSTDHMTTAQKAGTALSSNTKAYHTRINHNRNNSLSSSSSIFSSVDKPNKNSGLRTIKSGDEQNEEEKFQILPTGHYTNDGDTVSVCTVSTYQSTTASLQSLNGRKKKKKKKKKRPRIVQNGSHISCQNRPRKSSMSQSSDIPPITHSQHTPPHTPSLSLSQNNLEIHNKRMLRKRKRSANAALSVIHTIGDGIPNLHKITEYKSEKVEIEIVPNKTRDSFQQMSGFDDDHSVSDDSSFKPGTHDLTLKAQLYWTNIFAFLSSIDLMINIPTLYNACMDISNKSADTNLFIWILVIYVIFQIIAALIISCFMNYERIKWILVTLCTFLFFGNLLYTHGISVGDSIFLLFVGRVLCGISGSILVLGYSIVTLCSTILNRETLIVIFRFITSIGMVIGPLIGLLVSFKDFTLFGVWEITATNAGSFVMTCLSLLYLVIFVIYLAYNYLINSKKKKKKLNEPNDIQQMHGKQAQKYNISNISKQKNGENMIRSSSDEIIKRQKHSEIYNKAILFSKNRKTHSLFRNKYVILLLFLYISCLFSFWSFSAVIVPIGANNGSNIASQYHQSVVYALFAVIGFFFLLSFVINRALNYKLLKTSFDKRVIVAIQLQCVGYFLLSTFGLYDSETSPYSIPLAQLVFATFFICIGFGIATLQIPAIFCLITGTKLKNIGIRMSWFFVTSSVGRIIGPIFGYYVIKASEGSIDFLAHLSAFYLLIISVIALVIMMEANGKIGYFPPNYLHSKHKSDRIDIGPLHSERKYQNRVPSKSNSVTPYSRPKFQSHFVDGDSATKTVTNSKSKSKSEGNGNNEMKEESLEMDEEYLEFGNKNSKNKMHFNYSPVNRTESTESIKVAFKPKKTFLEKFQSENQNSEMESENNLLSKLKQKSSRLLGKGSKKAKGTPKMQTAVGLYNDTL